MVCLERFERPTAWFAAELSKQANQLKSMRYPQ